MTETLAATSHVVSERVVFTYLDNAGVITGYIDDHLRFVVEHVIALKPGVLIPMLKAGMREAKGFGCSSVVFGLPDTRMADVAKLVGCREYTRDGGMTFYEGRL